MKKLKLLIYVKGISSSVHGILEDGVMSSIKSDAVFDKEGLFAREIDQWFKDNYDVEFVEVAAVPGLKQMINLMPIFGCCVKVPFQGKGYMYASSLTCVFVRAHELGHLVDDGEHNILSGDTHRCWSVVTRILSNRLVQGLSNVSPLGVASAIAVLGEEFRASAYAIKCIRELRPNAVGLSGVMLSLAWMSYFHAAKKVIFI